MWWSGVVGVAGIQHHIRANERPWQAAYSSNKNLFCRPNQYKTSMSTTDTHSQTYTVSAGCKESKQTVQLNCSSKQPNQHFLFPWPSSTIDFATITQPIKSNNISNESLDNYLLNHVNRICKIRIIIL